MTGCLVVGFGVPAVGPVPAFRFGVESCGVVAEVGDDRFADAGTGGVVVGVFEVGGEGLECAGDEASESVGCDQCCCLAGGGEFGAGVVAEVLSDFGGGDVVEGGPVHGGSSVFGSWFGL